MGDGNSIPPNRTGCNYQIEIAERLARIEEKIDYIVETLDECREDIDEVDERVNGLESFRDKLVGIGMVVSFLGGAGIIIHCLL